MWRWSKRSQSSTRRRQSPLPRREVPTLPLAAGETHLVASPASSWVETTCFCFSFECFFFFLFFFKINTPTTLFFLLINLSPSSHALTLSRPWTPVSSPSTLKPFVLILFSIKRRKLLTKALYVSLSPSSISGHPVVHRACWKRHDV